MYNRLQRNTNDRSNFKSVILTGNYENLGNVYFKISYWINSQFKIIVNITGWIAIQQNKN